MSSECSGWLQGRGALEHEEQAELRSQNLNCHHGQAFGKLMAVQSGPTSRVRSRQDQRSRRQGMAKEPGFPVSSPANGQMTNRKISLLEARGVGSNLGPH